MKITVQVANVLVQASGMDMTPRQIKSLLVSCASIAIGMNGDTETEQEEPERPPLGFSAHIERAPDVADDYSEYFEE